MRHARAWLAQLRALLLLGAANAAGGAAEPALAQADAVTQAWEAARAAGDADAYERFLEEYADSPYADEAFEALIGELSGSPGVRGVALDMY